MIAALAAGAILIGVACAWLVTRSVVVPMQEAVRIAQAVASGDLRSTIGEYGRDETGQLLQALKTMNENLVRIVGEVREGTHAIAHASGEVAAGSSDLSLRTEKQAASLQQTAAAMDELTDHVRQNAGHAREANRLASTASEVAVESGDMVAKVVKTMGSISNSSSRIAEITGVIDGIAFQTNILALNAAVEAARAGDQGRGFSVVAAEVRALAQRSAAAAREIKALIADSSETVAAGAALVDEAGRTMQRLLDNVREAAAIMSGISAASEDQTVRIEQVNAALGKIDDATQQNAALVEQAAASARAMREQSQGLARLVSAFELPVVPSVLPAQGRSDVQVVMAPPVRGPALRPAGRAVPRPAPRLAVPD
jgi:methyl-accepting chemotaxis protein